MSPLNIDFSHDFQVIEMGVQLLRFLAYHRFQFPIPPLFLHLEASTSRVWILVHIVGLPGYRVFGFLFGTSWSQVHLHPPCHWVIKTQFFTANVLFFHIALYVFVVMPKRSTINLDMIFTDPRIEHRYMFFSPLWTSTILVNYDLFKWVSISKGVCLVIWQNKISYHWSAVNA